MTPAEKELKYKNIVNNNIYLNAMFRYDLPAVDFPKEIHLGLKKQFFNIWKANILQRTNEVIVSDKESKLLKYCFEWSICSPDFKGDLRKGLFIASKQGFGKDAMLKTIVQFYEYYNYAFRNYSYPDFCMTWFDNEPQRFNVPMYIADVYDNGKMKREKESIPFLELLDFREQKNNRRGLLVSSNYTPEALQQLLEPDKVEKRLHERMKECFNILLIKDADSKRVEHLNIID